MVPPDGHVHSEWSWDAVEGSMERTCARAVEIGLPCVAFTEHADFTRWTLSGAPPPGVRAQVTEDGMFVPPAFDVAGYLECLQRCRERFPELRILSGVELGEPHWHVTESTRLLDTGAFDRVLGSVHSIRTGDGRFLEVGDAYRVGEADPARRAADVLRAYLAEAACMVRASDTFAVLAHVDYALRSWPAEAGPCDPAMFEEEFREVLRALADTSRALEVNTKGPLRPEIVRWWYDVGGDAVSFGSDAHDPAALARGFPAAAAMVQACGFRPGRHPYDLWVRA